MVDPRMVRGEMTPEDFDIGERDECPHGSLRRSCEICERDEEIADLENQIVTLNGLIDEQQVTIDMNAVRIAELEWGLAGSKDLVKDLKASIAELESRDIGEEIQEYHRSIGVYEITEEQIDRAWRIATFPSQNVNRIARLNMLKEINIVPCLKCYLGAHVAVPQDCTACHRNGKSHGWMWSIDGLSTTIDGGDDD